MRFGGGGSDGGLEGQHNRHQFFFPGKGANAPCFELGCQRKAADSGEYIHAIGHLNVELCYWL